MPRLVRHEAFGPVEVKPHPEGKSAWVCMCGLSQTLPICDGSHKTARQCEAEPGKLYIYDKDRRKVERVDDER
jgi:CDGSH-type Zn-finger protein